MGLPHTAFIVLGQSTNAPWYLQHRRWCRQPAGDDTHFKREDTPGRPSAFFLFSLFLRSVDCSPGMMRGRIDRRELQWAVPSIQNIMPCTLRDKNSISHAEPVVDIQLISAGTHAYSCPPRFHTNELVCVGMHFHTDITTGRNAHERHLQMASAPIGCAKIIISPCCAHDIRSKWVRTVIGLTVTFHRTMIVHDIRSFPQLLFHIYAAADEAVNCSRRH